MKFFCLGRRTNLFGCMVKPRLFKRSAISITLFKHIIIVSSIRTELSKHFTDRCPLDLKCIKGGDMTLVNFRKAGAKQGNTVSLK